MTRINLVPVGKLSDQHLLVEHREIKRIPNVIRKGRYNLNGIPPSYTMGKGHVKYFYNKLWFLYDRYKQIHKECIRRGFNVQDYSDCFKGVPDYLFNHWSPTQGEINISKKRIQEKLDLKPNFYTWRMSR